MSNEDITPVRRQYLEEKKKHPGAILFFRLGDFYETFDEDAEITARELDIVLTSVPLVAECGCLWLVTHIMRLKIISPG